MSIRISEFDQGDCDEQRDTLSTIRETVICVGID